MILSKEDLKFYIKEDLKQFHGCVPGFKDFILKNERWFIHQYKIALRHVEYYINLKRTFSPFFLFWWLRYKHLGFELRYTIYPNTCREGLSIYHTGDMLFIKQAAKIGKDCVLRPGVVIGNKNGEGEFDMPVSVGNNVEFGLGVKVLGKVCIGDNVTIGANSVVTKSIADNSVAAGLPAKIIRVKE